MNIAPLFLPPHFVSDCAQVGLQAGAVSRAEEAAASLRGEVRGADFRREEVRRGEEGASEAAVALGAAEAALDAVGVWGIRLSVCL